MPCPHCRQENPDHARFCMTCGTGLVFLCLACGTELPAGAAFCYACGRAVGAPREGREASGPDGYTPKHLADKILASRGAVEGERKQVTVLFVDVTGFTSLSERVDPEDAHALMKAAFDLMLDEVHRYEGTVNQFLGDGIMALFGAPIAHEDHARRGVLAALGIRRALEAYRGHLRRRTIDVQVRQGLNTGTVVIGSIGNDLRMDYTAVGDTTNVAARLEQVARPGSIVIAEATWRQTADFLDTRALGPLRLKGKADPVPAWEVVAARRTRSRLDVAVERGLTALVGRDRELGILWDCLEKARAGRGQVVFIAGEPGIGKSRLVHELRRRAGPEVGWAEGRCVSFGGGVAFHPLIDLLRRKFGIEDSDDPEAIAAKIEGAVVPLGEDLLATVPYLRYLLGVDPGDGAVSSMDPQERRGELFYALRRLLVREAERALQVMVFEDIHWTDKATEDYLALVVDGLPASAVLLVLTHRTGYAHPFGDRSYQTRIVPGALSAADTVAMSRAILTTERLPDELPALIARKAEGNPFFVEELVKSLRESGSIRPGEDGWVLTHRFDDLVVPDTVQDVIAARIDRLKEAPKRALQAASAIGRRFSRRVLDRITERGAPIDALLRELAALELIHETRVFPEVEYTFKHALTQEVAYGSLLGARRQELHRLIALTIEDLYRDRRADHFELLAQHFARAEEWPRALDYLLRAADKAARAFATRDALGLYDAAEAMAARLADGAPLDVHTVIHRGRAELYVLVSDFDRARSEWEAVLAIGRRRGDRRAEGEALVAMGQASWLAHQFERSLEDSRRAADVAEAIDAPSILAGSLLNEAIVYEVTDRLTDARQTFDRALVLSRRSGDVVSEASALVFGAELDTWEGRYERAAERFDEGIRLGRAHNVLVPVLEGLFMAGINFTSQGAYDRALALLEEGLAFAEKVGDGNFTPRYLNSLGWLHMECGDLVRARALNQRAAEGGRTRGDHESFANAELNLGDIALLEGDVDLAREYLVGVHRMIEDPATSAWMQWRYAIHTFASLGELALARGDLDRARTHADECLERATRTRSRKYLVKGWRLRGEIATARRQWDDAEQALREAVGVAQLIGNPTQEWHTHIARARLHAARKATNDAQQAYAAAWNVIQHTLARLENPALRHSLGNAPLVRRVCERLEPPS